MAQQRTDIMASQRRVKALIAEDGPHIRILMRTVLTSMNIEIVGEAANGKEALALFSEHHPHLTFLDINMPVEDGRAALEKIKHESPESCVIMLSSVTSMDIVKQCLALGANNYIRKDTPIAEMKKIIKTTWENHMRKRASS